MGFFLETVTVPQQHADEVFEHSRLFSDPPDGLLAAIAWDGGDDLVTLLMLWETPGARGDFAFKRMMPLFDSGVLGEQHGHPDRLDPLHVYVRDHPRRPD